MTCPVASVSDACRRWCGKKPTSRLSLLALNQTPEFGIGQRADGERRTMTARDYTVCASRRPVPCMFSTFLNEIRSRDHARGDEANARNHPLLRCVLSTGDVSIPGRRSKVQTSWFDHLFTPSRAALVRIHADWRFVLAMVAFTARAAAQPVTRGLGSPEFTFDLDLSRVTALREFQDGRVVVVDAKERSVFLLDPITKSSVRIGREGPGPGEYTRPIGLVSLPGDSILIADAGNGRFLVLGAAARVIGTLPLVKIQPSPGVTYDVDISATDAMGRMYFLLPRGMVQNQEAGTPIVRFDRRRQTFDTIGRVFSPATAMGAAQPSAGRASFGMMAPAPFAARDEWAIAADGSVAVVRVEPYHVEWTTSAGAMVAGPSVPYSAIAVDAAEKEEWRRQARERSGTMTTTTADGRTTQRTVPVPEPATWPPSKPPFVAPAMIAPNGMLWLERSRAVRDVVTSYDVFAPNGRLVERVTMSATRRIVGFGKGRIYVAVRDDDDLLRVERYRSGR